MTSALAAHAGGPTHRVLKHESYDPSGLLWLYTVHLFATVSWRNVSGALTQGGCMRR
jgi:hypothetical protein